MFCELQLPVSTAEDCAFLSSVFSAFDETVEDAGKFKHQTLNPKP